MLSMLSIRALMEYQVKKDHVGKKAVKVILVQLVNGDEKVIEVIRVSKVYQVLMRHVR